MSGRELGVDGEVANVTLISRSGHRSEYGRCFWDSFNGEWVSAKRGRLYPLDQDVEVRRLVVIDPAEIPHLDDFYSGNPCAALNIIADDVQDIGQGDLDATEEIVRWLAEQMPTPPPCATCLDKPLAGFTCNTCGNGADS